jgi:hypothetical protein
MGIWRLRGEIGFLYLITCGLYDGMLNIEKDLD